MNKNMYFIREIARAFGLAKRRAALTAAFRKIVQLGRKPENEVGFAQFCKFMGEVRDETAVDVIIERDATIFASLRISPIEGLAIIDGITPGEYVVKLSTGLVIWRSTLSADDIIWARAFPERDLDLAAETEEMARPFSRRELLLDGAVALYVFPGVEAGAIGIEILVTT